MYLFKLNTHLLGFYAEENNSMGKKIHQSGDLNPISKDPVFFTLNLFECLDSRANTFGKKSKRYQFSIDSQNYPKGGGRRNYLQVGTNPEEFEKISNKSHSLFSTGFTDSCSHIKARNDNDNRHKPCSKKLRS